MFKQYEVYMSNTPMTVLNLRLPTEHVRLIRKEAIEQDLSASQLFRRIIKTFVDETWEPAGKPASLPPQPSQQLVIPPRAANMPAIKNCRKCSESIPLEEYNDFGGYCEQHGKKAI